MRKETWVVLLLSLAMLIASAEGAAAQEAPKVPVVVGAMQATVIINGRPAYVSVKTVRVGAGADDPFVGLGDVLRMVGMIADRVAAEELARRAAHDETLR